MTRIRDILNGCFMVVAAPFLFMAYVVMTIRLRNLK